MKRLISIVLALTMALFGTAFALADAAPSDGAPAPESTAEAISAGLPSVGDVIEGFEVTEVRDFPLVGGTAVLFEHEQTGAEVVYIANNDTNRVFDLTFFTRAIDNTGLPHVFEHAVLNGSEKYPSTELFFNLSFQTYNTYMNAMTYPLMTTFPVGSLSEEQLLAYADFYTDSCLHPSILTDESIYREEAWRYRLGAADDDLTIEGTVYSEMLGAMDLGSTAYYNLLRAAFPGSIIGNVSGGDPAFIPDMTWQGLKDYHGTYYVPSNCVAYLYGEFDDYAAFLNVLDEAFAPYGRTEVDLSDAGYEPISEPVVQSLPYPVEAASNTQNASTVYYAFICPDAKDDPEALLLLNTLTDVLAPDASPLSQALKTALPTADFSCSIDTTGPDPMIIFSVENVEAEDAQTFRDTVDAVLASVAENGFDQQLVDSVMSALSLGTKLTRESSDVGVELVSDMAYYYASSGRVFDYIDYAESLDLIDEWNSSGLYRDIVAEQLVGSSTTALVATYPEPGMREELDAAEAARLAEVKAAMTDAEIEAIVAATNAEGEDGGDASAYVAMLQAVTVESLPEEQREYDVVDVIGDDGVRRLTSLAEVEDVGQVMLLIDAAGLDEEQIHWFALYTSLLGNLDTTAHSREELATLSTRYLYSGNIRLSLIDRWGTDEYHPYLRASWIAADEDLATGYDLVYEMLYDTRFDDADMLLGLIQQSKAALKSGITSEPYLGMLYRSLGAYDPMMAYYDSFNYLPYYAFLENVEQMMETDPEAVRAHLEEIQGIFHNRSGAIATYTGSADGIETNAPLADAFLGRLDENPVEAHEYAFETPAPVEALIVDSGVQFNAIVGGYQTMGVEGYAADLDAVSAFVTDAYLFPMLRDQYGVYTPMHGFSETSGAYLMTYRDPNILETFAVYESLPDFIAGQAVDQATLDGYILSSYSTYAKPEGELSGAITAIIGKLREEPSDLKLQYMRELKSLTPEKLAAYATAYKGLVENGHIFTAGGAAAINAHADLYDAILNPFGAVDASQTKMSDVAEGSEHYEAVRFVYENMLMPMADETSFGVDDPATLGDLAGALYVLVGGTPSAPDEAVEVLAANGLLAADASVDEPLTAADADEVLGIFSAAVEIPYEPDASAGDAGLTRGELAEVLASYVEPLL